MFQHSLRMAVCVSMLFLLLPPAGVIGQESPKMVLKTYVVYDLISAVPNHRFDSSRLPTTERTDVSTSPFVDTGTLDWMGGMSGYGSGGGGFFNVQSGGQGGMGGMGGGGAGMGGDMGMGMTGSGLGGMGGGLGRANVAGTTATSRNLLSISADDLIGLITTTAGPDTWDEVGGSGTIELVGGLLVVRNDDAVQTQIGEMLDALRQVEERGRLVTLKARLLRLTVQQLNELTETAAPGSVNPDVLNKLSDTPSLAYCGQLSCLNGQTSFIVLGERHTVVAGSVPVVGGQASAYSVQTAVPNGDGALIELTPLILPGGERAIVDVHALITARMESQPLLGGAFPVDRVRVKAAQLGTTVRIDLGQPFLVGGLTDTQALAEDEKMEDQQQFYLVLELN